MTGVANPNRITWEKYMATEPDPQHEETDDEAPPQWEDSPHREGSHDE